ncbi:hypothetical protein TYRP_019108 [Tyrophagus putrescentiae]|nr:hypothetical protein TYRP_019108 [Tyrophagus putrescentiae]
MATLQQTTGHAGAGVDSPHHINRRHENVVHEQWTPEVVQLPAAFSPPAPHQPTAPRLHSPARSACKCTGQVEGRI